MINNKTTTKKLAEKIIKSLNGEIVLKKGMMKKSEACMKIIEIAVKRNIITLN